MKILSNFPYSPFTNKTGTAQRFLQNIKGLRQLGHDVVVWSISSIPINCPHRWKVEDLAIAEEWGIEVKLTEEWKLPAHFLRKIDLVWCNYYDFVEKFDEFDGPIVQEMHDLLSVHSQQSKFLEERLTEVDGKKTFKDHPELYKTDKVYVFPPLLEEIRAYKKCKCVVTISSSEDKILQSAGVRTKYIPYQDFTEYQTSERTGLPLFVGTRNIFNLFAVDFLGELIVPSVRSRCFDFEAQVVGEIGQEVRPFAHLVKHAYCDNIEDIYKKASFGLSPMLWGTGSKVKLYEMMAHGLPVVGFNHQIGDAPVNKETGFACGLLGEFVDGCEQLWRSAKLRKKLGNNAKEAVRSIYSLEDHLKDLGEILCD